GVRPRVAWHWMWIVPTGYCFLLQAGGIANDAFPTVDGLAMMDFALRAREKCRGSRAEGRRLRQGNDFGPWTFIAFGGAAGGRESQQSADWISVGDCCGSADSPAVFTSFA